MTQVLIDRATLEQLVAALEDSIDCVRHEYETYWGHELPTRKAQIDSMKESLDRHEASITASRAALANAEPAGWQPIETAPKGGKFLIAVWEGDWDNPKRNCTLYQATGFLSGPVWAMRGNYRTEEGGAYILAGWMPLPAAPKDTL